MWMKRTETIQFRDFMSGEYKNKGKGKTREIRPNKSEFGHILKRGTIIPIVLTLIPKKMAFAAGPMAATTAQAVQASAISDAIKEKIAHAFDPLIDLMVSLSLPIAGVMLTGGSLLIMIGQKDLGYRLIMNSALGYVLVQMSPLFIDLLAGVGKAI